MNKENVALIVGLSGGLFYNEPAGERSYRKRPRSAGSAQLRKKQKAGKQMKKTQRKINRRK